MAVLGTHTLVNSFLSPGVFFLLAILFSDIPKCIGNSNYGESCEYANSGHGLTNGTSHSKNDKHVTMNATNQTHDNRHVTTNATKHTQDSRHVTLNGTKPLNHGKASLDQPSIFDSIFRKSKFSVRLILTGFGIGLLCYIRVDLVVFMAVIGSLAFLPLNSKMLEKSLVILSLLIGFGIALIVGGLDDLRSYGTWFISPYQWYHFNIRSDMTTILFGLEDSLLYIYDIFLYSSATKVLTGVCFSIFPLLVFSKRFREINRTYTKHFFHFTIVTALLLVIYSSKGHKETRFMHNSIVLILLIASMALIMIYRYLNAYLSDNMLFLKGIFYLSLTLYVHHLLRNFPTSRARTNSPWTYMGIWDSNHVNECLDFVRRQNDVTGVFLDRSIHMTGAYSVLHQNVPIFTLVHFEFHEFSKNTRKRLKSNAFYYPPGDSVNVSVLNRVSNYITTENTPLLIKTLINQDEYNYFIVTKNNQITRLGFKTVHQSGTMFVLQRETTREHEISAKRDENSARKDEKLRRIAASIPLGSNSTVLEYEGSWLMTLGLYHKAIERLSYAMELESSRIRPYQLLAMAFTSLGKPDKAKEIQQKCYQTNSRKECNQPQKKVVLHKEYNIRLKKYW